MLLLSDDGTALFSKSLVKNPLSGKKGLFLDAHAVLSAPLLNVLMDCEFPGALEKKLNSLGCCSLDLNCYRNLDTLGNEVMG